MSQHPSRADGGGPHDESHVLVVDDAPTVRMYHGSILRGAGFQVDDAANGLEALEMALGKTYDLMLVDVNMPLMDGHAFVGRLRDAGICCAVVMVSTQSQDCDSETAYRAGANLVLTKPVAAAQLLRAAALLTSALPVEWAATVADAQVRP